LERGVHAASMFKFQCLLQSTEAITLKQAEARAPVKIYHCQKIFLAKRAVFADAVR
jgi:hypothetical protein